MAWGVGVRTKRIPFQKRTFYQNSLRVAMLGVVGLTPIFNPKFADTGSIADQTGNAIPTFSRAVSAYVADHEGFLRLASPGEVRFQGLRRVRNLLNTSESVAAWAIAGVVPPTQTAANFNGDIYPGVIFPIGGNAFAYSNAVINAGQIATNVNLVSRPAGRIKLFLSRPLVGAESLTLYIEWNGDTGQSLTLTSANSGSLTVPTVMGFGGGVSNGVTGASAVNLRTYITAGGPLTTPISLYAKYWQVEDVIGQTIQTPAEYISVGVKPAPIYHGAAVDGVRYFPWANGNTINNNIITENVGATIATAIRKGYLPDPAITNLIIRSEDLNDPAWVKTRSTIGNNVAISPNGEITGDKLIEDATAASTHFISTPGWTSVIGNQYTVSIYAKAAERFKIQLGISTAHISTGANAAFILTGVGTAVALDHCTCEIELINATSLWYRCSITIVADAVGVSVPSFVFLQDGTGTTNYNGDGASGAYLFGGQVEQGGYASSYIPTGAATVNRPGDFLVYPNLAALLASSTVYTQYIQATPVPFSLGVNPYHMALSNGTGNERMIIVRVGVSILEHSVFTGGIAQYQNAFVPVDRVSHKTAMRTQINNFQRATNGGLGVLDNNGNLAVGMDRIGIGCFDVGNSSGGGTIAEARLYPYGLTDSQLQALTT